MLIITLELSIIKAVFGIEREFDRYYLRLKQMLRGNYPFMTIDKNIIEYVTSRTFNREEAWDEEEHEFENLDNRHNELICFISQKHKSTIDIEKMKEALLPHDPEQPNNKNLEEDIKKYYYGTSKFKRLPLQKHESMVSILSAHS